MYIRKSKRVLSPCREKEAIEIAESPRTATRSFAGVTLDVMSARELFPSSPAAAVYINSNNLRLLLNPSSVYCLPSSFSSRHRPLRSHRLILHLVETLGSFLDCTFMKHQRAAAEQAVSLALSLSLGAAHADRHKKLRRAGAAASGEFVCKTCSRSFPTFQALGGHRTSHLRARHGLALALAVAGDHYSAKPKKTTSTDDQKPAAVHQCHVCGLSFEMGQALGGHMRRHRDEAGAVAQAPPVLLQLFV
jgi:hypothetical protein